ARAPSPASATDQGPRRLPSLRPGPALEGDEGRSVVVVVPGWEASLSAGGCAPARGESLPAVPVDDRLERGAAAGLEVGAERVRDRDERGLHHLVVRDPEQLGGLAFVLEVERRP